MGFIPSHSSEVPLVWSRGAVNPVLPSSGWHDDLLLDYVGYVDEGAKKDTPVRICAAVAMGDMVEPLLDDNGLQNLYTAWQHVNTPGMQSQIIDIIRSKRDAELK